MATQDAVSHGGHSPSNRVTSRMEPGQHEIVLRSNQLTQ